MDFCISDTVVFGIEWNINGRKIDGFFWYIGRYLLQNTSSTSSRKRKGKKKDICVCCDYNEVNLLL